jgi:hypothetical protein
LELLDWESTRLPFSNHQGPTDFPRSPQQEMMCYVISVFFLRGFLCNWTPVVIIKISASKLPA